MTLTLKQQRAEVRDLNAKRRRLRERPVSDQTAGCKCYGCVVLVPKLELERDDARANALIQATAATQELWREQRERAEQAEAEVARLREALDAAKLRHGALLLAIDDGDDYGEHVGLQRYRRAVYEGQAELLAFWESAALTLGEAG